MTENSRGIIGTPHQQALLDAVVALYRDDPRARAVIVFGSLARGDWHRYSDIDLDIVLEGEVDAAAELRRMAGAFAAMDDRALVMVEDGDSGDLVLASLNELSVRFHALATTSPNIIADMLVPWSSIDQALIREAGAANRRSRSESPSNLLARCLRYAVGIDIACRRDDFWMAVELLHRVRGHMMDIHAAARHQPRPLAAWQSADAGLQALLRRMLPGDTIQSLRPCLDAVLETLDHHLDPLSSGTLELSAEHRELLAALRRRIAE